MLEGGGDKDERYQTNLHAVLSELVLSELARDCDIRVMLTCSPLCDLCLSVRPRAIGRKSDD